MIVREKVFIVDTEYNKKKKKKFYNEIYFSYTRMSAIVFFVLNILCVVAAVY